MSFGEFFILILLFLLFIMALKTRLQEVEHKTSLVDNRRYLVRKLPDSQQAADMLANINQMIQSLIRHLVAKYPGKPEVLRLYERYDPDAVSEGGHEDGYTSYTVDKGVKLVICIRNKDNTFADQNTIRYVVQHELAHLSASEIGHTKEFWDIFKFILQEAVSIGLYMPKDYKAEPQEYCGITISSSII
eukprot:jgi/Chrzof1/9261/UNPLg00228.t1